MLSEYSAAYEEGLLMGYLLLLVASLAASVKGFAGKRSSLYVQRMPEIMLTNALRMLLCMLISSVITILAESRGLKVQRSTMLCALLYGATLALNVAIWIMCARGSGYLLVSVFGMMGMLVSLLCSSIFLNDSIHLIQLPGVVLLIGASIVMCRHRRGKDTKLTRRSLILLIANTLTCGLCDFAQKLFADMNTGDSTAVYSFYCYVFAAAFLLCGYLFICGGSERFQPSVIHRVFPYTCLMAVTLFINTYARTLAGRFLPAAQFYPVYKGMETILGVLMAAFVLREKPDSRTLIGVSMAFAALLLIRLV